MFFQNLQMMQLAFRDIKFNKISNRTIKCEFNEFDNAKIFHFL